MLFAFCQPKKNLTSYKRNGYQYVTGEICTVHLWKYDDYLIIDIDFGLEVNSIWLLCDKKYVLDIEFFLQ